MARNKEFILERSNKHHIEVVVTFLLIVFVLAAFISGVVIFWGESIGESHSYASIKDFFNKEIKKTTPLGLFYISFFGNLLFVPLPIEIAFVQALRVGQPAFASLFFSLAGLIPAYALDYFIGARLSSLVFIFISPKKIYKSKRWVNTYGPYAIFGFNLLPLPSNELTFGLGIARYNVVRLFVFTLCGSILKFIAIMGFFWIF